MSRFLALTGLTPDQIRAQVETPEFLAAVLEHLVGDESLLLVFAANTSVAPETVSSRPGSSPAGRPRDREVMTGKPGEPKVRLGVDLGGTKIAGVALGPDGTVIAEHRIAAPRDDYAATLRAMGEMVARLEQMAGTRGTIGIGMPGSISPVSGLVQNANSTWLNGQPFARDVEAHLGRPVRLANDANCFALSEAVDGAGAGAASVFGVILGTGCGGGLVFNGRLIDGPRSIGGEWGHNPLPWATDDEHPGPALLVRPQRMHGDVGVGPRPGGGS